MVDRQWELFILYTYFFSYSITFYTKIRILENPYIVFAIGLLGGWTNENIGPTLAIVIMFYFIYNKFANSIIQENCCGSFCYFVYGE